MRTIAIIPAYNEEKTVGNSVTAAKGSRYVNEVFVVNDGSCDRTSQIARDAGATVIEMGNNRGKGAALQVGLQSTASDIIVFLDADLIGIKTVHVDSLVLPVLEGEVDMTLGIFEGGRRTTDLAQKLTPFLTGQRAVRRQVLQELPNMEEMGFGVEVALTRYVKTHGVPYKEVILHDVSQVMKEEKFGLINGISRRLRMYWDIVRTLAQ
ncbi:MAG: glycosyltransferase family 2 protein [Firmicutes bacterium]|nr:glycosyltransferase family 2 protein [Bacillota bacterium]